MKFTDSHCHLDFSEFDHNRPALLNECALNNIHQIIIPAIAPSNWQHVLELVHNNHQQLTESPDSSSRLFACLGIHPWFLNKLNETDLTRLDATLARNKDSIIAVGEAGIDLVIAKNENNLEKQIHFFNQQLDLANKYQLPIIVHHRRSHQEVLASLKKHKIAKGGIIHAFSGSYQQAINYIDLGFKLGVGGTITYPRAEKTIKAIKRLPLSSLVLETDAPAMPLFGYQGQINQPLRVTDVFTHLCEIRDESPEEIAKMLEENVAEVIKSK